MIIKLNNKFFKKWLNIITKYILLLFITGIFMFPIYWIVVSSLRPSQELFTVPPTLYLKNISFEWYMEVFLRTEIPHYFVNSFILATLTTIISLIISILGAYSITKFSYKGRDLIVISLLISYAFPPILLFVPIYLILIKLQLINTLGGALITHITITLPFCIYLLKSFFNKIPIELEEAAWIDGCSRFRSLISITLPLVMPGVFSAGIFAFIFSWNEYLYSSVILTESHMRTITVGIAEFVTTFDIRWGAMMAAATLTTIPVFILFSMIQKYFIEGLLTGGVKG